MEISYDSCELSSAEKRKLMAMLLAAALAAGLLFYGSIVPAAAAPIFYRPGAAVYGRILMKRRKRQLILQFRDLLQCLSASFSVGRHMKESLSEAYGELAAMYDPGDCIMREISGMLRSMTEGGQTDIEALEGFARRAGAEDIDIFVQVFRACRETGGDMAGAMNKSAAIIGEKIIIENEIQMMAVQKKYEGRIITAMPVIIIIFLRLAAPEYLEVMYETTAGHLLMTLALAATAGAYYLIERITDIEV